MDTSAEDTDKGKNTEKFASKELIGLVLAIGTFQAVVLFLIVMYFPPQTHFTAIICTTILTVMMIMSSSDRLSALVVNVANNFVKVVFVDGAMGMFYTLLDAIKFAIGRIYDDFKLERVVLCVLLVIFMYEAPWVMEAVVKMLGRPPK